MYTESLHSWQCGKGESLFRCCCPSGCPSFPMSVSTKPALTLNSILTCQAALSKHSRRSLSTVILSYPFHYISRELATRWDPSQLKGQCLFGRGWRGFGGPWGSTWVRGMNPQQPLSLLVGSDLDDHDSGWFYVRQEERTPVCFTASPRLTLSSSGCQSLVRSRFSGIFLNDGRRGYFSIGFHPHSQSPLVALFMNL